MHPIGGDLVKGASGGRFIVRRRSNDYRFG